MAVWDFPCPGCGVTTSVTHAVRGDLLRSVTVQPLGLVVTAAVLLFAGWAAIGHVRGRDLWTELRGANPYRWSSLGVLVLVLSWMYKIAVVRGWF